ncbi:integrase family protein [Ferrimonas sp. SCSIO 43195]|uniref:integrase family protein n=1 Tax=Ferrimonas sp. SCSIO 43195 TaxID=2822844 RepID=UPI00207661A8|nr:integrase family protein [Ferrimonas sp. SCSIO 43195]USD39511.1 integrase family protein [Ferrimonas sp. SCSIO 43195]
MSIKMSPKQQVLALLDQCLATGVRGRVQAVIKQAIADIEGQSSQRGYQHADSDINETDCPGLIFKVGKHTRRWVYRYTPSGARSTRQVTLGYYPQMDRAAAVAAWEAQRLALAGSVPQTEAPLSLNDAISRYIDDYARQHRPQWRRERQQLERWLGDEWGEVAADALTPDQALQVVRPQQSGARQRLALLRHFYRVGRGLCDELQQGWLPPTLACPFEQVQVSQGKRHSVQVGWPQVGRYLREVNGLEDSDPRKLVLQLQLTNLGSLAFWCQLQWQDIDWQAGLAQVGQGSDSAIMPLSPASLELLKRRQRSAGPSVWVFPSHSDDHKSMPHHYPAKLMQNLRASLGLPPHFTASALARLGQHWLAEQGREIDSPRWPLATTRPSAAVLAQQNDCLKLWVKRLHIQKQSD